jgi:hypothetical protein
VQNCRYFEKELFAKFANSVAFLSPDVGQFIKLANKGGITPLKSRVVVIIFVFN